MWLRFDQIGPHGAAIRAAKRFIHRNIQMIPEKNTRQI